MNAKETTGASRGEKTTGVLTQMRALSCLVLLGLAGASIAQAAPTISIQGLTGAEHWVWIEGEQGLHSGGSGSSILRTGTTFRNNDGVSGYMESGPSNSFYYSSGSTPVRNVQWTIHAPADMSSGTKIYARARVGATSNMEIRVDNAVVSPSGAQIVSSGLQNPTQFLSWQSDGQSIGEGISTGALAAGDHVVRYYDASLVAFMVDGLLLYDGTPILRGVTDNGTGRRWLQNPGSLNSPVISGTNVTPSITIAGLNEGNQVYYFLNGQLYTPGSAIGVGDHELVVAIFESDAENSTRIAFAGANFTVSAGSIPEPGTFGLLTAGTVGACVLLRRRPRL